VTEQSEESIPVVVLVDDDIKPKDIVEDEDEEYPKHLQEDHPQIYHKKITQSTSVVVQDESKV
jgi:hypothetical protein